jgi:hypothetical protein
MTEHPSASGDSARPAVGQLAGYLAREVVLALVVFGCTAVLIEATPPRHPAQGGHCAATEGERVRATRIRPPADVSASSTCAFAQPTGKAGSQ